jgi:hypothetical protein
MCPRFPPHRTRRRWRARRRRGETWGGKQAAGKCDWSYPRSFGGGGSAGEVAGERRRRSRGGTAAEARTALKIGAGLNNVLHGQLPCVLGKVLGGSLGSEDRRRSELGNGGPAAAAEARAPASRQFG